MLPNRTPAEAQIAASAAKWAAVLAVLDNPRFSQTEALVMIDLIARSDDNMENAYRSQAELLISAKISKKQSLRRALDSLKDEHQVIKLQSGQSKGHKNSYDLLPRKIVDSVVEAHLERRQLRDHQEAETLRHELEGIYGAAINQGTEGTLGTLGVVGGESPSGTQGVGTLGTQGVGTSGIQGTLEGGSPRCPGVGTEGIQGRVPEVPSSRARVEDTNNLPNPKDRTESKKPPTPLPGPEALRLHPGYPIDQDYQFANGQLTLVNGQRSEWLGRFDGDVEALDLALIKVAGRLQVNSSKSIATQANAHLAEIALARRDQDRRYQQAKREREKQPKSTGNEYFDRLERNKAQLSELRAKYRSGQEA